MSLDAGGRTIAGVDGCRGGWIGVTVRPGGKPEVSVDRSFARLVDRIPADTVIAIDMPIGLPDRIGRGGRGPERLVRPLIGMRQSSVFSIPSRQAVYAEPGPFASLDALYAAHRRASDVARDTSEPKRGVSIQAFGLLPKIRELDALLRGRPELAARLHESHPELAFWRLNGERPVETPKKIRNRINPAGMAERRLLLVSNGFDERFVSSPPPAGAAADDFLDACAMLLIAARITRGLARPFPDPPDRDGHQLPVAIWA